MTRVRYTGAHAGTLMDYTDLATGRALTVVPGRVYDVAPASGRGVPEIPAHCVALYDEDWQPTRLLPAADPDPELEPAEAEAEAETEDRSDENQPGEPAE